jgi:DNA mismatch repair protein MutS2
MIGVSAADAEAHSLTLLELAAVLDLIAEGATSDPGRRHVRGLRPWKEPTAVERALRTTDEMVGLLLREEGWEPPPIPDASAVLRRLSADGSVLEARQLMQLTLLLSSSRRLRADLRRQQHDLPLLAGLGGRLLSARALEDRLARSVDAGGDVADGASAALKRVRHSLRQARASLVRSLEAFARSLPARFRVPDASVTVRNGRYCVPIRREGVSHTGGIVHDESATHRTAFVEPPAAIEPMNRIAELEREEAREVERVLMELTDLARPHADELEVNLHTLAEIDSLYARGRYALEHGGSRPVIGPEAGPPGGEAGPTAGEPTFRAVDAFHPLLRDSGEPAVPFDLELRGDERVLLISGPNAGGKTVLLKAVGLLSVMAQSGIIPPVGAGTRLPLFRRVFAIIGDEQSIQASLSTFSAQVESLRVILEHADPSTLVLIDELGGNTDPAEGAALAGAVLLSLAGQAGLTVATTHLGELKQLAAEEQAIVNASLQFDTGALRPTYRLQRDRPGRSYALEIAGRLGIPESVLAVARSRLSDEARRVERLLGDLEAKDAELERRAMESRIAARRLSEREERVSDMEDDLRRREAEIEEESVSRAERYLLAARGEVAQVIDRLRAQVLEASKPPGVSDVESVDLAVREARAEVERLLREAKGRRPAAENGGVTEPELAAGDRVRSGSLGVAGRVAEVCGDEIVLESGGMRFTLPARDLERMDATHVPQAPRPSSSRLPELTPRTEVDLRGSRVEEIEAYLSTAVDAAYVSDLPSLRVIHGKGTGALREEVRRVLGSDPRISRFRDGAFEEGGSGVTVVEFGKEDG